MWLPQEGPGLLDGSTVPARSPFQTGSAFHCLSPRHPNPAQSPSPSAQPPPCNLEAEQTFMGPISQCSMSYILSQRGLIPSPLPTSPLPSLLSPRSPPRPCQQAGRKLLIVGRVGHFQLTLNNPGLGYKEPGPSAPITRHPPQPPQPHTYACGQGLSSPKVRVSTSSTAQPRGLKGRLEPGLPPSGSRKQGPGYSPTEGLSPSSTRANGGWGLGQPPQWQKTQALSETKGLGSQRSSPKPLPA